MIRFFKTIHLMDYKNMVPKIVIGLVVALIALVPVMTGDMVIMSMLIFSGLWAIAAMGFTMVLRTGQFSLGQSVILPPFSLFSWACPSGQAFCFRVLFPVW
jgi:hypothetical protein